MQKLRIYTDGGSRGNPGPAAVGVVIYSQDNEDEPFKRIHAFGKKIGNQTNNVAEYKAVIEAWKWLIENKEKLSENLIIDFYLDSFLVANQLNGRYKLKSPNLTDLLFTVKELQQKINAQISYHYVMRFENMEADYWVNKALEP